MQIAKCKFEIGILKFAMFSLLSISQSPLFYSPRSAWIGSMRAARMAG
jgi:hypothetical protein